MYLSASPAIWWLHKWGWKLHVFSYSECLPTMEPGAPLILWSPLEIWVCSEALVQMHNILFICSGQYGFLAFLGTLLSSSLPQKFIALVLVFHPSPSPNSFTALSLHHSIIPIPYLTGQRAKELQPGAPRPVKTLRLLPLCDVGQYSRLEMTSHSLSSSFLRGSAVSKLVLWPALTKRIWWSWCSTSSGPA